MKLLDIGEVADRTGVPASTLRYYDEVGLIASVSRRGLRRQFEPDVLLQLALIAMGKTAGFALADIARMFGQAEPGGGRLLREDLAARADRLDRQIRDLTALRDTLRHVADCPAPSHLECPSFRRLAGVALRRQRRARRRDKHDT